jgi:5'-phosphate synthase pdxT subunit
MSEPVGVLALQGDFALHEQALARLDVPVRRVRRPAELAGCRALIMPGGESTTMSRLLDSSGLRGPLREFAQRHPVLGTCAGLILLARELEPEVGGHHHGVETLGLLDIKVLRNGYGRQVDSFQADLMIPGDPEPFHGVFIRAPRVVEIGPDVEVIARHGDEAVAVRQGRILGVTFHPELTDDPRLLSRLLD